MLLLTSLRKAGAAAAEPGTPVLHPGDIFELAAKIADASVISKTSFKNYIRH